MSENILDPRIGRYRRAVNRMRLGDMNASFPVGEEDDIGLLGESLISLGQVLRRLFSLTEELFGLVERINNGQTLEEILNFIYDEFQRFIPYERIGFALLEDDARRLRACWARSTAPDLKITGGYEAPLKASSLQKVIETGKPRILNDLEAYLQDHPESESTRLIIEEGMRSSLTCPLLANGRPIGFMFFSSTERATYQNAHVETFSLVAGHLALIVEKARLYERVQQGDCEKKHYLRLLRQDFTRPLSVINSQVKRLQERAAAAGDTEYQKTCGDILDTCGVLFTHLNDMDEYSELLTRGLKLELKPADLLAAVTEAVRRNEGPARLKKVQIEADLPRNMPHVRMDRQLILFALDHVIARGTEFTPSDSPLTIAVRLTGGWVTLDIAVPAPGLPGRPVEDALAKHPHCIKRVFEQDDQLAFTLAIVRKIVEAHAGRLTIEATDAGGSDLTIRLPVTGPMG